MTADEWQKMINAALFRLSSNWDPSKAEYHLHTWQEGGYSYFKAGTWDKHRALRAQEGLLHFAGEHTSDKFSSMNGAIVSGLTAAEKILHEAT